MLRNPSPATTGGIHAAEPLPESQSETGISRRWIVLVWVCIVALYLGSVTPRWFPTPDSALYLMLGRSLAAGGGLASWSESLREAPPGFPLLLAALAKLGLDSLAWQNLALALLALLSLSVIWVCLRLWATDSRALLVLAILAGGVTMHHCAIRLLSDIPFVAVAWTGIYCYSLGQAGRRTRHWLGLLLLLAACLVRVVGIFFLLGVLLDWAANVRSARASDKAGRGRVRLPNYLRGWRGGACVLLLLTCSLAGLSVLKSQVDTEAGYEHFLDSLSSRSPLDWITLPLHNFYVSGEELSLALTGQSLAPALAWILFGGPICLGIQLAWRREQRLGVWLLVSYLGGILLLRPLLARYIVPVSPLLILYFLSGIERLAELRPRGRRWSFATAQRTVLSVGLILLAINLPKVGRAVYWLHVPQAARSAREVNDLLAVADFLRRQQIPGDRFMSNTDRRMLEYLSEMESAPLTDEPYKGRALQPEDLQQWRAAGATFYVVGLITSPGQWRDSEQVIWETGQGTDWHAESLYAVFQNAHYNVYAGRLLRPYDREYYEGLHSLARTLRQVARLEDCLASTVAKQQIAYLSGVRAFAGDLTSGLTKASVTHCLQQGVTLVTVVKEPAQKDYWNDVRKLRQQPGLYEACSNSQFAIFSTRLEVAQSLEPDERLRATAALINRHRQPEDRLVANVNQDRLAFLSQVPGLPIELGDFTVNSTPAMTAERLEKWLEQGATWMVIRLGDGRTSDYWEAIRAVRRTRQMYEVQASDYCHIFCTRPIVQPTHVADGIWPTEFR